MKLQNQFKAAALINTKDVI